MTQVNLPDFNQHSDALKQPIICVVVLLAMILTTYSHAKAKDDELALRKSYAIQLYMSTCVVGRTQPEAIASQIVEQGFSEAPKELATKYLGDNPGDAWHTQNQHGTFGIAILDSGLCSIFVHQGDPKTLQASMEAWLPPKHSGFSYKKELTSQTKYLTSTAYKIYRDSNLMEQWVITVSNSADSELIAIMSHNSHAKK